LCGLEYNAHLAICGIARQFTNKLHVMNKNDLSKAVAELNALVSEFRFEEALDKFYDDEIISVENENSPTVGLPAYKVSAKRYLSSISNPSAKLLNVLISDDMSVTEWRYTFEHKEWGKWDAVQLSVQRWKNGKIVHERHHYNS
jgi:hypothetical protein